MRTFVVLTALLLFTLSSFCQQPFTLKISVPASFPLNKLSVMYNDGLTAKELDKDDIKHEMVITGSLHSLYGSVNLVIETDSVPKFLLEVFFFGPGNSSIEVLSENVPMDARLANAFNTREKGRNAMEAYCEKEQNAETAFLRENEPKFGENRALFEEAIKKVDQRYKKQLSFIKNNASVFYSFRLYHQLFTPLQRSTPIDTLMMVFQQFPDNYKNTEEGQFLFSTLQKLDSVNSKLIAPDFNVLDIMRDTVSLKRLKGRYVIIDFWATWCAPCMKVIPSLIKISGAYPDDKLAFISVSLDHDTLAYTRERQRLPATWKYIYGDDSIRNMYGVTAIPVLFLIDPEGKVIFKANNGHPDKYIALENILKERIKKTL